MRLASITANPFEKHRAKTQRILHMFWGRNEMDTLTHRFLLEVSYRSKGDSFSTEFLREARQGELSWTMYNFIHGYATTVPGSWIPNASDPQGTLVCASPKCKRFLRGEWLRLFRSG